MTDALRGTNRQATTILPTVTLFPGSLLSAFLIVKKREAEEREPGDEVEF